MKEYVVDLNLKMRVSVKTEDELQEYTVKEMKMLMAKKVRQAVKKATIEDITKNITKQSIIHIMEDK